MHFSKAFLPTLKEAPQGAEAISHQLLLRSGMIRMLTAGVYYYLPLGLRVLDRIERIIREEMNAAGGQELLLSCLQPLELWKKTGRDKDLDKIMIRFTDRRGREMCLGPTHEEVITDLVAGYVNSYRQLPLILYQIQTKFRDEVRPRFGIIRACEFIMKDAYSFDRDKAGLDHNYKLMYDAYGRIFKRCGLDFLITEADSGIMGGDLSHEYMVPATSGEDYVVQCGKCRCVKTAAAEGAEEKCPKCDVVMARQQAVEIGHIFQLGTKYSKALNATFVDEKGEKQPIIMGCYGIGVSRMIAAIVEQNHDKNGIIWPSGVAPFDVHIVALQTANSALMQLAGDYYRQLRQDGFEVLFDDREESAGIKFKDADLIGVPVIVILGEKNLEQNTIEIKIRRDGAVQKVAKDKALPAIQAILKNSSAK